MILSQRLLVLRPGLLLGLLGLLLLRRRKRNDLSADGFLFLFFLLSLFELLGGWLEVGLFFVFASLKIAKLSGKLPLACHQS